MLRAAILVLPLFLIACSETAATAAADGRAPAKAQTGKPILPSGIVQSDDLRVTGAVLETMNAGPYTYVRLNTADGEIWAAVNEAALAPGAEITIGNAMWMEKFESKTLNRKFDRILFGSLLGGDEAVALPPGHPSTQQMTGAQAQAAGAGAGTAAAADLKVEKAPGKDGRTIAEIYASKAALKGKDVDVRGAVVKWNPDILGRNWVHLRDGSGSPERQDNDLTVTTS
ncbi:MAG: nucleotide-binding protein, partial [Vicinamibacteria bacterium]|nr:nucleotide-binding protein [Vicinamibacteria bacterium]